MSKFKFQKATKEKLFLRAAFIGPPGSGKSYSALRVGCALSSKVAVIDTEHRSARKYADLFTFDVLEPTSFSPMTYVEAIQAAEEAGYEVIIIDSLSHAWMGKDGALEQVDRASSRSSGNSFAAWRNITPQHNQMVEAIIAARAHMIVTMRSKTDYVMEEYTDSQGKKRTRPVKVGLAPIQRDGVEYEFDVVGDMDLDHNWVISKSRCPALSGKVIAKPGENEAKVLLGWLNAGVPMPERKSVEQRQTNGHHAEISEITSKDLIIQIHNALKKNNKTWLKALAWMKVEISESLLEPSSESEAVQVIGELLNPQQIQKLHTNVQPKEKVTT